MIMTFGPKIPCGWISGSPTRLDAALSSFAVQDFGDVGGEQTAAVEALVHNGGVLSDLRVEVAIERGQPAIGGVGHVDVGHFAAGHLIHFAAVLLDPGQVAQIRFRSATGTTVTSRAPAPLASGPTRSSTDLSGQPSKKL